MLLLDSLGFLLGFLLDFLRFPLGFLKFLLFAHRHHLKSEACERPSFEIENTLDKVVRVLSFHQMLPDILWLEK